MKERLLKYVKYAKYAGPVGYPIFYVFCLAVFASLTFPYRRLKEHIVTSFNAAQVDAGAQQELQVDDMSGYWLSGVRMTGVTLLTAPSEPGKSPARFEVDDAVVRYQLLPMLIGNSDTNFEAHTCGGEVSGSYDLSGKDKSVDVTLDSIELGKLQPLVDLLGVPLGGKVGGSIRLTMPDGKASKANGSVALEMKDVTIGDGKAKIKGALALPRIDVGTLTLDGDAKDGTLKVTKLAAGGRDIDVQGDGRIVMRELATDSRLDMQVRFKINDAYRNKSDVTKSLFGAPGSNVPALFELADPKIKQSKRPDGFYAWAFRGALGKPDVTPASQAVANPMSLPTGAAPASP